MKAFQILISVSIILGMSACSQQPKTLTKTQTAPVIDSQKMAFNQWLSKHQISENYFKDTITEPADSLWDYANPLERTDSLYRWYPSKDSSYYLLTNIDMANGQSIFKKNDDIEYRFLDSKKQSVHIGITLLNDGFLSPVDIFWYDQQTIYLLEKDKANSDFELIKLKMNTDSIWSYRKGKLQNKINGKQP